MVTGTEAAVVLAYRRARLCQSPVADAVDAIVSAVATSPAMVEKKSPRTLRERPIGDILSPWDAVSTD